MHMQSLESCVVSNYSRINKTIIVSKCSHVKLSFTVLRKYFLRYYDFQLLSSKV